jgi:exopolysaccharide biosynthesis protein
MFLRITHKRFDQLMMFLIMILPCFALIPALVFYRQSQGLQAKAQVLENVRHQLQSDIDRYSSQLSSVSGQFSEFKSVDYVTQNQTLKKQYTETATVSVQIGSAYENLVKLRELTNQTAKYDAQYAKILKQFTDQNLSSISAQLKTLNDDINTQKTKLAAAVNIPANVPSNNSSPDSGYRRQKVSLNGKDYLVDIVAGNLGSTKVIVDTASESTCTNNCPVLPLSDYVARNAAYAGVNGGYFCPDTYPSCAGKTNSFDTLLMNKNKTYFNSDNNVYSVVPAVVFGGSWVRFVEKSLEWGRDTGIDSLIANPPLLVSGGQIKFSGDGDPKKENLSNRGFVSNKGNTVYIGVVHTVTAAQSAQVLQFLGMENALNLDSGGSTAFWVNGGYKVGPGRNLPNVILFLRK